MLVNITIGSAWNVLRHLQNLEAIVETAHPTDDDAAVEALATHTLKDVQAEIGGMKKSILLSTETNADRLNMLALAKATKTLMEEYRDLMGDDTPEITDVYDALKAFDGQWA